MISVLITYYNRKKHLLNTMRSYALTKLPKEEVEFLIMDEESDSEHQLHQEDFSEFGFLVRLFRVARLGDCPVIQPNDMFLRSVGDIIVLQNPECIPVGDVLSCVADRAGRGRYLSFECYNSTPDYADRLFSEFTGESSSGAIKSLVEPVVQACATSDFSPGWYNHRIHRPLGYHFLSALTRKDFELLNGFDERFAPGVAYGDDEFIFRVRKLLRVVFVGEPFCIHQQHPQTSYLRPFAKEKQERNKQLLQDVVVRDMYKSPLGIAEHRMVELL